MPLGEATDNEQAQPLAGTEVERRRVAQPPVDLRVFLVGHAQAAVLDLEHGSVGDLVPGHVHGGVRRGEGGGVLDQFREHVDHVADGVPADGGTGDRQHLHPGVVLDLGDRATHDILDRNWSPPATSGLRPGQHDEVLGVTAHPGRQVVEPEQFGQLVRVGLLALQRVDDLQLAMDERLAAAGEVEEGVADALAHRSLLDSGTHGDLVDGAERLAHLPDLVLRPDPDGEDLGFDLDLLAAVQPFHNAGQAVVGHFEGSPPQPPKLADHGACDEQRDTHRHGQDQHDEEAAQPGVASRVRGDRVALLRQVGRDLVFHQAYPGDLVRHGLQGTLAVDGDRLVHLGREHDGVAHLGDVVRDWVDRFVVEVLFLRRGGGAELRDPGILGTGVRLRLFDDRDVGLVEEDHRDAAALLGGGLSRP